MEPLLAGDPTELGECQIRGRLWTSGALTVFQAERDGDSVAVLAVKNGPQITDTTLHNSRIAGLAQSLKSASTQLGASVIAGGSSGEYSYLICQLPQGKSLRGTIYSGKLLSPATTAALIEGADQILTDYTGLARILVTPDTVYVNDDQLSFMGLGAIELLDSSAAPGSSLGVNALEWFAPETLAEGSWTTASAKFSLGAALFAASAASPWREPVRQLSDLFRRSIDIGKLQSNPQLESLFPWLNARPDLRVLETITTITDEESPALTEPVNDQPAETQSAEPMFAPPSITTAEAQPASKRGMYIMIGIVSAALIAAFAAIGISALGGDSDTTATTPTQSTAAEEEAEATSSSTPEPTPTPETTPDPEYQVKLDYSSDSIPNQPPTDGLQFTFDVCSGDPEWLTKSFTDDVQLQFKAGTAWATKSSVPKVVKGGRCDSDQYNLTISHIVTVPEGTEPDSIWSGCLSYRVNLPETDNYQEFSVPFCAFVRQTV